MSRALLVLNIVIVCLLILVSAALYFKQEKIAFINTSEIYDDFQLKKDLELKLKNITQSRKSIA
jgi:Skp family chaperone for outer membrane proteins